MAKEIIVTNWGKGQIKISSEPSTPIEVVPRELHFKEDGAIDDSPSLTMVLNHSTAPYKFYGQFTLNTLIECLDELGYTITKK